MIASKFTNLNFRSYDFMSQFTLCYKVFNYLGAKMEFQVKNKVGFYNSSQLTEKFCPQNLSKTKQNRTE